MTILLVPLLFVFLVKKNMSPGIYPLLLEETVWGPGRGETHCLHPQQDQDSGPVAWAPAGSKRIGPQLETCAAFHSGSETVGFTHPSPACWPSRWVPLVNVAGAECPRGQVLCPPRLQAHGTYSCRSARGPLFQTRDWDSRRRAACLGDEATFSRAASQAGMTLTCHQGAGTPGWHFSSLSLPQSRCTEAFNLCSVFEWRQVGT